MTTTTVQLATGLDSRYVTPLKVMLRSLVDHLDASSRIVLHVAHRSLTEAELAELAEIVDVRPVVPAESVLRTIPTHPHFPPETAFCVILPEILPELERVIFFDADLLVLDDVTPLWLVELEGKAVAAVPDGAIVACGARRGVGEWETLGISKSAPYFNCGVLVIDLEQWRTHNLTARTLAYLVAHLDTADFLHQEAMNAVLWNAWKRLDPSWNALAAVAGRRRGAGQAPPRIVHFAGRMKPWLSPIGGPYERPYAEYLRRLGLERPRLDRRRRLLSVYDRYARGLAYPLEHAAWRRGWL